MDLTTGAWYDTVPEPGEPLSNHETPAPAPKFKVLAADLWTVSVEDEWGERRTVNRLRFESTSALSKRQPA